MAAETGQAQGEQTERPNLLKQVYEAEQGLVLEQFALLKERGNGEMRVAARRDPRTGLVEITYAGVHEKTDLDGLRKMYAELRRKGTRF
jgi:hypothetical protein